ncbi:MAG: hypothetical protein LBC82_09000 [Oscillospiraceae bacterium]|jgi:hypothetical protein|nr:hypothetical protein [Oscillospiraceae bacterium]
MIDRQENMCYYWKYTTIPKAFLKIRVRLFYWVVYNRLILKTGKKQALQQKVEALVLNLNLC